MDKLRRIFTGGIRMKIFSMLLITIVLMIAAYTAVFFYQSNKVEQLVNDTYETQKQVYLETGLEDQFESMMLQSGEADLVGIGAKKVFCTATID